MYQKKQIYVISILLAMCILGGCGADKTKTAKKPSDDQIAISGYGAAETDISYNSIAQLKTEAETIIYGEVKDYHYEIDNGSVYTIETVEVLESLYGSVEKGDSIQIFKVGGYVTLEDYINSFGDESKEEVRNMVMFANYTDEEIKEKYMKQFPDGEVDTDVGSKAVYFLRFGEVKENTYNRVGSWEGEYVELSDGDFKIPGLETYEEIDSLSTNDGEDSSLYENSIIGWDALKEEIGNS